ncbi:MAG: hypothetical protein AB1346_13850 [Thermodesulfobacteriota bacterium]
MRFFVYSMIAIPLLLVDSVLLYTLPVHLSARFTSMQFMIFAAGAAIYLGFHFFVRKPERLYLWGHELTHLLMAKIFFRQVHGFHITSRSGGKVVIDRTNVAIDLAPYAVPIYSLAAILPILLFRGRYPFSREFYLAAAAFFFTMHISFSLEGFVHGQPDLRRSGRLFSGAVVALSLILIFPVLLAPATHAGMREISAFFREWFSSSFSVARHFLDNILF